MVSSPALIALLDANVLYPAPLLDYLLRLADVGLYKPKWTDEIQEEWIRNLLLKRTDLKRESLEKTREAMDSAFPDSTVSDYQELIKSLSLPDKRDRHVLAAAIKSSADVIVTFNLKDFPAAYVKTYAIDVQHPDDFIVNLIRFDKAKAQTAFANQVSSLKNPPKPRTEVLKALEKCGLKNCVLELKELSV